jgi:hypothetical protein
MRETILFLSLAFILTSGAALGQEKATPQRAGSGNLNIGISGVSA